MNCISRVLFRVFCFIKRNEIRLLSEKKKLQGLLDKEEMAVRVYRRWRVLYTQNKRISSFLKDNDINEVAIYGMGRIGKDLLSELKEDKFPVKYIIDKKYESHTVIDGLDCYTIVEDHPAVDLIIVAVTGETEKIKKSLMKMHECDVKSIQEILFSM